MTSELTRVGWDGRVSLHEEYMYVMGFGLPAFK